MTVYLSLRDGVDGLDSSYDCMGYMYISATCSSSSVPVSALSRSYY